jgi:ActR/RegA family two-component response regulator
LTQINGRPTPLGTIYGLRGFDTDMMAQRTVVIVVDDDASLLKSVARLLEHHGIESRTFASAEALLESDSMQTATCLLLDIHLGGISGISAAPACGIGIEVARHLHDRERRRGHAQ